MKISTFIFLFVVFGSVAAQEKTGIQLELQGWQRIAKCHDGHTWSYILEKTGVYQFCRGINAFTGPMEKPCVPFRGDLEKFKALAEEAKRQSDAYDVASKEGRLEKYLRNARREKKSRLNCWHGFGQNN
jgi:hypothetical protein